MKNIMAVTTVVLFDVLLLLLLLLARFVFDFSLLYQSYKNLKFPSWPKLPQMAGWKIGMKKYIDATSKFMDGHERVWFDAIEQLPLGDEFFEDSFKKLADMCWCGDPTTGWNNKDIIRMSACDKALREVTKIFTRQLLDEVQVQETETDKLGYSMTGRQYVLMMYKFFKSTDVTLSLHSLHDLIKYQWKGDSKVQITKYRNTFRTIMESIPTEELGHTQDIRDQQFQRALEELAAGMEAAVPWGEGWPCGGTPLALTRHGALVGGLAGGKVDVAVGKDMEVFVGASGQEDWEVLSRHLAELYSRRYGWSCKATQHYGKYVEYIKSK